MFGSRYTLGCCRNASLLMFLDWMAPHHSYRQTPGSMVFECCACMRVCSTHMPNHSVTCGTDYTLVPALLYCISAPCGHFDCISALAVLFPPLRTLLPPLSSYVHLCGSMNIFRFEYLICFLRAKIDLVPAPVV